MEPIDHYCFLSRYVRKIFFQINVNVKIGMFLFLYFFLGELAFLFSLLINICSIEYTIKEHPHLLSHKTHTIFAKKKRVTVIIITLLLTLQQPLCAIFNYTRAVLD